MREDKRFVKEEKALKFPSIPTAHVNSPAGCKLDSVSVSCSPLGAGNLGLWHVDRWCFREYVEFAAGHSSPGRVKVEM